MRGRAFDWIFLDVGGVLMDETPWLQSYPDVALACTRAAAPQVTRVEMEALGLTGSVRADTPRVAGLLARYLGEQQALQAAEAGFAPAAVAAFYTLCGPAPGARQVLRDLRKRYRVGVIANQHPRVHAWMARHGLAQLCHLAVYDCDVGCAKPDRAIFEHALRASGCQPCRSAMVGDRLDNDVRPARALGMGTVHVTAFPPYGTALPLSPDEEPDVTAASLLEVPAAIARMERLRARRPCPPTGQQ